MKFLSHAILLALFGAPNTAHAAVLRVPGQYGTIQSAINASHPGDVVEIQEGAYHEHLFVAGKSDLTIRPAPGDDVILDAGGSGYPLIIGSSSITTTDIVVKKLTIRNIPAGNGVWIGFSNRVRIEKCDIRNVEYDGISSIWSSLVTVKKCTIDSIGRHGIFSLQGGMRAVRNTVSSTGGSGIILMGSGDSAISNTVEGLGRSGIELGDGAVLVNSCLVQGNRISNAQFDGIACHGNVTGCTLTQNRISSCDDGIDLKTSSTWIEVFRNSINRCTDSGIEIRSGNHVLRKNKIKRAGIDGIWVSANAVNGLYERNKVTKSSHDGLEVLGTGNMFRRNKVVRSSTFDLTDHTAQGSNTYVQNTFGTIAP